MKLERELEERKFQHENRIRFLKTQFLKDKQAYEERAEAQVRAMANRADKVLCPGMLRIETVTYVYHYT